MNRYIRQPGQASRGKGYGHKGTMGSGAVTPKAKGVQGAGSPVPMKAKGVQGRGA